MQQVTWRVRDDLLDRVRTIAGRHGWSVNEYLTRVLDAATDPDLAGEPYAQIRERLSLAGLLAPPGRVAVRPDAGQVAAARGRAGTGTPLSDTVSADRG
ncbi:transcriptional regulator [Geodermatophilus marinus]|uniref:transcriptional regulator n=1 Tax=Geodermatophilus sp. LHW52908 TaxID=2303986 RepID=UPI000E3D8732|nr:transcriptional regulator [Geodermatophilus sp. LHW52908]RFU21310.1 transcriptional regulator [Geodermatophilus sp. LHW52908]